MGSSRPPPRTQDFFPAPALSLSLVRRRRSIILSIFSHKKKKQSNRTWQHEPFVRAFTGVRKHA
jgi:hypothetical protein